MTRITFFDTGIYIAYNLLNYLYMPKKVTLKFYGQTGLLLIDLLEVLNS